MTLLLWELHIYSDQDVWIPHGHILLMHFPPSPSALPHTYPVCSLPIFVFCSGRLISSSVLDLLWVFCIGNSLHWLKLTKPCPLSLCWKMEEVLDAGGPPTQKLLQSNTLHRLMTDRTNPVHRKKYNQKEEAEGERERSFRTMQNTQNAANFLIPVFMTERQMLSAARFSLSFTFISNTKIGSVLGHPDSMVFEFSTFYYSCACVHCLK